MSRRRSAAASQNHSLFGDAPIPLRPAERPPSKAIEATPKEKAKPTKPAETAAKDVLPFSVKPPDTSDMPRTGSAPRGPCAWCDAPAEGHYGAPTRDGKGTHPLCNKCGPAYHPTLHEVWKRADERKSWQSV